jgi:hypothetical protein
MNDPMLAAVQSRLGRLDAALQATQGSAEALGLEAETPELKAALALALHLLGRLRTGWFASGLWSQEALAEQDLPKRLRWKTNSASACGPSSVLRSCGPANCRRPMCSGWTCSAPGCALSRRALIASVPSSAPPAASEPTRFSVKCNANPRIDIGSI